MPDVLSRGLGPGGHGRLRLPAAALGPRAACPGLPRALRAKLPFKLKVQYLLSASYFLSGWTVLIYMSFPVVRLLGGGQPHRPASTRPSSCSTSRRTSPSR